MSHNLFFLSFFFAVFYKIKLETVRFVASSNKDISSRFCLFFKGKGCGAGRTVVNLVPVLCQQGQGEQEFRVSLGHRDWKGDCLKAK